MSSTIVESLPLGNTKYDYIIVGGGTAGCVIAARLAESLPDKRILVIEGGGSEHKNETVLNLKNLVDLWGSDMDYSYYSVVQPNGNSNILHSRAKLLGGCSSHNGSIAFHPVEYDMRRWEAAGVRGWSFELMCRLVRKLRTNIVPVAPQHRSQVNKDWVEACSKLFNIPVVEDFNKEIVRTGNLSSGVGFINVAYTPSDNHRSSASVAYIHPILDGDVKAPNLTILVHSWVSRIITEGHTAVGVEATTKSGERLQIFARDEVVLSAGSIDSPRLMMLSGLGPRKHLQEIGIPVVRDIPGVGQNLQDHCETMYMWEMNETVPEETVISGSEVTMTLRREQFDARGDDGNTMDCMFHMFTYPFDMYTKSMGYETPNAAFCVIPNTPRPLSVGSITLKSSNPKEKPVLDQRYFSDEEGYDKATNLFLLEQSRRMAQQSPFKEHLKREIAPGPNIKTAEQLCEYGRKVSNTVYHPCGTAKMGDLNNDPMAVVSSQLKVRGVKKLRVADASVFPFVTTVNPMVTVLALAERAAELIIGDAQRVKSAL
ncbi:hypothetical protein LTR84_005785 [Exophiala bonariae]|uniref:Glucose-methanol-choline oxidoreductase N-terminal domain-containing protein n=1 Tax=Exophiala bonariae TaxID=1690606 RepID=A0AAV9N3B7_9EURO|nr:hypothetical protein LTR84_005785 [Exophiala bonariae]